MKLKEIFDQLTYGELSQLSIGGDEQGTISPANYSRILAHVNLGLTALYKRFPIKEGRVVVQLVPPRTDYPIESRYAAANPRSREAVRYVLDTPQARFKDDILKIERVYGETGYEFSLNDLNDWYSLRTPTATTLHVPFAIVSPSTELPEALVTETLEIAYRANHPILVAEDGDIDPEEVNIELPYSHLEPLLLFVASRVHTPIGMQGEGAGANIYMQKYEMACQQIEQLNLRRDQDSQSDRLRRNGWV
jgi:hypothetical protein